MTNFTIGDGIAIFAVLMVLLKYVTERWNDGSRHVASEALNGGRIDEFLRALTANTAQLKELSDQYRNHELECAEFRGRTVAAMEAMAKSSAQMERDLNQLQSQIRLVTTKGNNRTMQVIDVGEAK